MLSRFCDSAPIGVEDVVQFVQNHSETLSPTEHVRKDSGIYPELPKYIVDVIVPSGLPYGKQKKTRFMCGFRLSHINDHFSTRIWRQMRSTRSYT